MVLHGYQILKFQANVYTDGDANIMVPIKAEIPT
jgi:hypothetical protein